MSRNDNTIQGLTNEAWQTINKPNAGPKTGKLNKIKQKFYQQPESSRSDEIQYPPLKNIQYWKQGIKIQEIETRNPTVGHTIT